MYTNRYSFLGFVFRQIAPADIVFDDYWVYPRHFRKVCNVVSMLSENQTRPYPPFSCINDYAASSPTTASRSILHNGQRVWLSHHDEIQSSW